jgi:hypothetical protein
MLTIVGAGLAYGWTGVATVLASNNLHYGYIWVAVAWGLATAAVSATAALSEMSALQSRPAIQVAPVVFVIQTAVPVALAPVVLGEHFTETPLSGVLLALSLLILMGGAVILARSPLLLALMEAAPEHPPEAQRERVSLASDSAESPSERVQETMRSTPPTETPDPSTLTTSTSPARIGP